MPDLRTRSRSGKQPTLAAIDIGTSRVCCLIAAIEPASEDGAPTAPRLLGLGLQRSRGVRAGTVVDLDAAERSVAAAIVQAEEMAGVSVEEVVVAMSGGALASLNFTASAGVAAAGIARADIERVLNAGREFIERDGQRALLHMHRLGYVLDGARSPDAPLGMAGHRLGIEVNAVTADAGAVQSLGILLARSYLPVAATVAAPYAAALATLSAEEAELGACVIDMGAGITSCALFSEGRFVHAFSVPIGGMRVTQSIARALSAPFNQAERIKTLYGTLEPVLPDEHRDVEFQGLGEGGEFDGRVTRGRLRQIMVPEAEELLLRVLEGVERAGCGGMQGRASSHHVVDEYDARRQCSRRIDFECIAQIPLALIRVQPRLRGGGARAEQQIVP